jgi:nucleotide-binding universal stress UspA family protein
MTDRVLVFGDDGSTHADRAWLWINNQRWPGWSVDVVTARPDRRDIWSDEMAIRLTPWKPDVPRQTFAEAGIAALRHLVSPADPRLVLDSRTDASLVVVGARGRGMKTLFLGSTADHLLRHAPAPLVIATTPAPVTRVLVCTDGSAGALRAVQAFADLPLAAAADHIAVIGVATVGIYDDTAEIAAGVHAAAAVLQRFVPERIQVQCDGDVAATIVDHLYAYRPQLVVVGTRGLSGLRRVVLGSTANTLAHAAPCSVLIVPDVTR